MSLQGNSVESGKIIKISIPGHKVLCLQMCTSEDGSNAACEEGAADLPHGECSAAYGDDFCAVLVTKNKVSAALAERRIKLCLPAVSYIIVASLHGRRSIILFCVSLVRLSRYPCSCHQLIIEQI